MRTECQRIIVLAIFFILALASAGLYPAGPEANAGILAPPTTPAPTVVTLYPVADTFVDESNPNQNYGREDLVMVGFEDGNRQQAFF